MKKITLMLLFTTSVLYRATAQDIHFSQYDQAPQLLNPALTAVTADFRHTINYRDQWRTIGVPYKTFAFSSEAALFKKRKTTRSYLGVGLNAFTDKAGDIDLANRQLKLSVNGILKADDNSTFSLALQGGFGQHSYNLSAMQWGSQYNGNSFDPSLAGETPAQNKFNYGDFSTGIAWHYGKDQQYISANNELKMHLGVAFFHANTPKHSFYATATEKQFSKILFHGGATFGVKNSNLQVLPTFMYSIQGPSQETVVGGYLKYVLKEESKYTGYVKGAAVSIGMLTRLRDSFSPAVLMEFANYAIGISYDVNTSPLRAATNGRGGLELMLRYRSPSPFLYQNKAQF